LDGRADDKMIEVLLGLIGLRILIKMIDNDRGRRRW
tara:strand:- start:1294 stop:1401 length:108 start_codon:yes stop_codon:yes gene_type:complete